jgi:predicted TIM-barrel fold metal-dependent hydrolase
MAEPLNVWLAQVREEIVDSEQPIVDPHHHLWAAERGRMGRYLLDELWADTGAGHRVTKTVFVECRSGYREDGPEHLRPVGETDLVAGVAARSAAADGEDGAGNGGRARIAAIVGHADLTLGDRLGDVLDAHVAAGGGLFRGIRHQGACDPHPDTLSIPGRATPGLYARADFREGVRALGGRGLTFDAWHFHHQNAELGELARACPETTMILDHFGTPLGVGRFAGRRDEVFAGWKRDLAEIARCPNVCAKLGGLAMPDNGFGWNRAERPPTSDEVVAAQERYYHHAIECFGPERCMFESNFPVDRLSVSYTVIWNAFKKMAARYSKDERHALFHGTAERVYRV